MVALSAACLLTAPLVAKADASSPAASSPATAVSVAPASAGTTSSTDSGWWQQVRNEASQTWDSDRYELYLPLHTWHNRRMYTAEKIAEYNENPWGLGFGKYRYDDQGNWHAFYAMAFLDSHNRVEPIAGYGYEKIWHPAEGWRLGAGFTVAATARQDYGYYPLPLILPLVSIEYGHFALQTTYVPGSKGNGNVLFTWARWQF
ncbi:antimicrobial peptide resistance and lipid A acylation protein PagP [Paludibacterium purpuratum]|uniref:Lipid A acyltransferase PagP n=2 Tax=Paludibacterium purpuratum TaxID=1144873 RepID=A0A4R7B6A4_9NEIS|nr:antimicrobial peptide resistance and lipid A acylation protein PagP [Paludibacterium purpuratum]